MTRLNGSILAAAIACLTALNAGATQQTAVALGSNASFAVLAGTTVTVTGGGSITGNIGISPGLAFVAGVPPVTVNGTVYAGGPIPAQAQIDLTTAFNDAAGRQTPVTVAGNIGGQTLTPGLYKSTSSLAVSSGDLTLDAQGNSNAVFIFQIASSLTLTSGRQVILAGGANAANIFWQVGSSATLGTTSVIHGTIMAAISISMLTGSRLDGRALAQGGAVSIDTGGGSSVSNTSASPATCSLTINQPNIALTLFGTAPGGFYPSSTQSFTVTATNCPANVLWEATVNSPWVRIESGNGAGNGTVVFTAFSSTTLTPRTATIFVSGPDTLVSTAVLTEAPSVDTLTNRQVRALYQAILGREPDVSGFAFWTGLGRNGLGQMTDAFLTSPESTVTGVQTMAIYRSLLGRVPTATEFFADSLRSGGTLRAGPLFLRILNSPEYAATNGSPTNYAAFVNAVYNNMLGRAPTATELANSVATLVAGGTGYVMFADIFAGNEYRNIGASNRSVDHTNTMYLSMLYLEFLGRDSDPSGYAFWLAIVNSGGPGLLFQAGANATRDTLAGPGTPGTGFLGSSEFQGRF